MPNLAGITNPVPNYENTNHVTSVPIKSGQTQIQNVVDPSRIVGPDGRTEQKGADESTPLRYDSNLQFFLQQLRERPELAIEFTKAIVWIRGVISTPGLAEGAAKELSDLLRMMQMDTDQFRHFFMAQMKSGNRFSGPLFDILRQICLNSPNENVQNAVLNFVKKYSDYSSTAHIGKHMLQLLKQISEYIPRSWSNELAELAEQLKVGLENGERSENLKLLQGKILPYLGSYIEKFHDLGTARSLIGMFSLDIARYENGSEPGVLAAFRQMIGYSPLLSGLSKMEESDIWALLQKGFSVPTDPWTEQFAKTASTALRGEYGAELRDTFQEIMRSFLINESVYMPLKHAVIPLDWQGKSLYSEFWIDPNAEDKEDKKNNSVEKDPKIQFLFKMDVESLGFLEMTLASRKDQVELNVYGPKVLTENAGTIARDIQGILEDHGLTGKNIQVLEQKHSLNLMEVFPNLLEGKHSVNVKI